MSPSPRLRLVDDENPAESVLYLRQLVRAPETSQDEKIVIIADAVVALSIRGAQTAEATKAVADTAQGVRDDLRAVGGRLEAVESGVLEAVAGVGRIERAMDARAREAHASDVDLLARVEREQAAREALDERMRQMMAPIVADATRRGGNSAAAKTAGAFSLAALVTGLAAQPVETIKLLREIGPAGAGVAVVSLLVALVWARRRGRPSIPPPALPPGRS